MGYFITSAPQAQERMSVNTPACPPQRHQGYAHPKTHTPDLRSQGLGLRFYSATLSRWISRDPICEIGTQYVLYKALWINVAGMQNGYLFCNNASINIKDYLGLTTDPVSVVNQALAAQILAAQLIAQQAANTSWHCIKCSLLLGAYGVMTIPYSVTLALSTLPSMPTGTPPDVEDSVVAIIVQTIAPYVGKAASKVNITVTIALGLQSLGSSLVGPVGQLRDGIKQLYQAENCWPSL